MLERLMWEVKMVALTSAVQRAIRQAIDVDGLSPHDVAQATLIAAITYMRTTKSFSPALEQEFIQNALKTVPSREQAPHSGLVVLDN